MVEIIAKTAAFSPRRIFARHMARQAGAKVMSPENPRELARKRMDAGGDRVTSPTDVDITEHTIANLPALKFSPQSKRAGTLLFLHGGGYCLGSAQSHKPLVARLAKRLRIEAISVNYRLAPEHVFPSAVEDGARALAEVQKLDTGPILIAGDSAGGGLSLATLLRHRSLSRPMVAGIYLISPWTDLTGSGDSTRTRAHADPMLKPDWLTKGADLYLDGADPRQPEASPLFAEYKGFPPVLIQTGDDEILRDDSLRLAEQMKAAGVPVQCEIWQAMWHDFPLFAPILPEAERAHERVQLWAEPLLSQSQS